ncbi:MAG: hypothetical protein J3R72DRAFT_492280 [Linnemannia gamsii]|nr:MAG: hypothetical protein J3R72DRAFT_492280 [Linnemannia gamsii]
MTIHNMIHGNPGVVVMAVRLLMFVSAAGKMRIVLVPMRCSLDEAQAIVESATLTAVAVVLYLGLLEQLQRTLQRHIADTKTGNLPYFQILQLREILEAANSSRTWRRDAFW